MEPTLDLGRVQGNILPGFETAYQALLWLAFPSADAGRRWLRELAPEVASAARVMTEKEKRQWSGYGPLEPGGPATTWINVAFSWPGLVALGASGTGEFSTAFKQGMAARAAILADPDPRGWLVG